MYNFSCKYTRRSTTKKENFPTSVCCTSLMIDNIVSPLTSVLNRDKIDDPLKTSLS